MLYAYLDESGQTQQNWILVGGYLGTEEQWAKCESAWKEARGNRKSMHLHDLRFNKDRDRRLLNALGPIPTNCGLQRLIGGVNVSHYADIIAASSRENILAGYQECLIPLIICVIQSVPDNERVFFVFEQQRVYEGVTKEFMRAMMQINSNDQDLWQFTTSTGQPKIVGCDFLPKHATVRFEPADYLVYAVSQNLRDPHSKRAEWCSSIIRDDSGLPWTGRVMSRVEIRGQMYRRYAAQGICILTDKPEFDPYTWVSCLHCGMPMFGLPEPVLQNGTYTCGSWRCAKHV